MKWDFAIGNPAYQDQTIGDNQGFAPPIYDKFIDAACDVADKVELIHPARFLFNAGSTPKAWNEKMLADTHFKVLEYHEDAAKVFSNTDIKGGVAITYRDQSKEFGAIGIFTQFAEMNSVLKKVLSRMNAASIADIGVSGYSYHFTEKIHIDNPDFLKRKVTLKGKVVPLISKGHEYDLKSNIIDKLPSIFFDAKPNDGREYIIIVGRSDNERVKMFVRREYITFVSNLDSYKLFVPKASGVGAFGEQLGPSILATPGMGHTETFFSIGCFSSNLETENLLKYLKSKFARALLSILKKTQNITPGNFKYVPLQDFTGNSDIIWSASIANIDKQLYKKYGLSKEEIDFIETHVKEME